MSETLPTVEFAVGASHAGSNSGVVQATKKVRKQLDYPPNTEDSTVDETGWKVLISGVTKASYKSTLMGLTTEPMQTIEQKRTGDVIMEVFLWMSCNTFNSTRFTGSRSQVLLNDIKHLIKTFYKSSLCFKIVICSSKRKT